MDAVRFDRLARACARRLSRRAALRRAGAGLVVAAAGAGGLRRSRAAQDATPLAGTPVVGGAGGEFLFVQSFAGGTYRPKAGEAGVYELTLTGGTGQTVYFADRPGRDAGTVPTPRFLDSLGFGGDPPNAALVAQTDAGEDVLVVELTAASLDEAGGTLTYEARPLAGEAGERLASLAARQADQELADSFGAASLFIDGGGCPYPICGGLCCSAAGGMVCQANGSQCVATDQLDVCRGGNVCNQDPPNTECPGVDTYTGQNYPCYCGTTLEGGGGCFAGIPTICEQPACATSGDCAFGELCAEAPCCGTSVCLPLCQLQG